MIMEQKKQSRARLWWLIPLLLGTIYVFYRNHNATEENSYQKNTGMIFGTIYHFTYQYPKDLKSEIEEELKRFDASLSPFNPNSIITKINLNEDILTDTLFQNVFRRSMEISEQTDGAFDITIAPLANAWGFGFKKGEWPDSLMIDSLVKLTDYRNVKLVEGKVIKKDPRIMISCSAIAKGYASDVIADFLSRKGIKNYMVEIGGEIAVKGVNPHSETWSIGINKPTEGQLLNQELQMVIKISDVGLATSGNYRNFYYRDGKKYAHTIDPRTGYPVLHNLLSATVIAKDCMTADALATAFMVMGLEKAEEYVNTHPDIYAYFIYDAGDGKYDVKMSRDMEKYISFVPIDEKFYFSEYVSPTYFAHEQIYKRKSISKQ